MRGLIGFVWLYVSWAAGVSSYAVTFLLISSTTSNQDLEAFMHMAYTILMMLYAMAMLSWYLDNNGGILSWTDNLVHNKATTHQAIALPVVLICGPLVVVVTACLVVAAGVLYPLWLFVRWIVTGKSVFTRDLSWH